MKGKLVAALLSIAVILLVSSTISVMEYSRMSNYVSSLIAEDINNINVARKLTDEVNTFNLSILAVIGDQDNVDIPDFDVDGFMSHCDSLRRRLGSDQMFPMADSIEYSCSAYLLTALELEGVLESDFIDSRNWYFNRLQPRFERLSQDIDKLSDAIYADLQSNSRTFDRGFYRSIIPGIVAVGVGLLLVLMLLFFLLSYYVNPLYGMLDSLNAYRTSDKSYGFGFDGDDQLSELNAGIREVTRENQQLRSRISALRKGRTE